MQKVKSSLQVSRCILCPGQTIFDRCPCSQNTLVSAFPDRTLIFAVPDLCQCLFSLCVMTLIAPTDLVDAAKAIISKLNMKKGFNPLNYENPSKCLYARCSLFVSP